MAKSLLLPPADAALFLSGSSVHEVSSWTLRCLIPAPNVSYLMARPLIFLHYVSQ